MGGRGREKEREVERGSAQWKLIPFREEVKDSHLPEVLPSIGVEPASWLLSF